MALGLQGCWLSSTGASAWVTGFRASEQMGLQGEKPWLQRSEPRGGAEALPGARCASGESQNRLCAPAWHGRVAPALPSPLEAGPVTGQVVEQV